MIHPISADCYAYLHINPTSAIELRHALLDAEINQVRVHLTDCFQVEV